MANMMHGRMAPTQKSKRGVGGMLRELFSYSDKDVYKRQPL